jgi:copper chaperone CopZ
MKKYLFIIICLLFSFPFQGEGRERGSNRQVVALSCDIHCQGCIDKIMKNIAFEKGVKDIVCDLDTKTVTVTFDANKTDVPTLLKAFDKIKKPAKVKEPAEPTTTPKKKEP